MLSEEEIIQIKKQLTEQINTTFPEDKKAQALEQINAMTPAELEQFLKQNNIVQEKQGETQCIFCMITSNQVPSHKIGENEQAIATLEINPISYGHTIIIPKIHQEGNPHQEAFTLANQISEKIKKTLNPKNIDISESSMFGHSIINILPIYENETIQSQRTKANPEDLQKLQTLLTQQQEIIEKPKEPEKQKEINNQNTWLPKRIP